MVDSSVVVALAVGVIDSSVVVAVAYTTAHAAAAVDNLAEEVQHVQHWGKATPATAKVKMCPLTILRTRAQQASCFNLTNARSASAGDRGCCADIVLWQKQRLPGLRRRDKIA